MNSNPSGCVGYTVTKSDSEVLEDIDDNDDETELESEIEPSDVLNIVTKVKF